MQDDYHLRTEAEERPLSRWYLTLVKHVAAGQNQWYHFGVGEFTTHFRTYFSGDWEVHWEVTGLLSPWPCEAQRASYSRRLSLPGAAGALHRGEPGEARQPQPAAAREGGAGPARVPGQNDEEGSRVRRATIKPRVDEG